MKSRLVSIPERLIPVIDELKLLDNESLESIKGWIQAEQEETHLRNRKILDSQ